MQTTAIGTVANSLPENEVILLTLLISKWYILFAELRFISVIALFVGVFAFLYLCGVNQKSETWKN